MNHEIRTPLNAISGFNDVLNSEMSESMTTDEKSELINMISINSRLLTTLVSDVIDSPILRAERTSSTLRM